MYYELGKMVSQQRIHWSGWAAMPPGPNRIAGQSRIQTRQPVSLASRGQTRQPVSLASRGQTTQPVSLAFRGRAGQLFILMPLAWQVSLTSC